VQKSLEANAAIVAERKWNAQGALMKEVSQAFAFADGNLVKQLVTQALEAKLGPQQQGDDGKKDKKGTAAQEAKAAEAEVVEKPTTPFVAVRVHEATNFIGKRVLIKGWVHELRVQSKMVFLVVRDAGSGFIQCLLSGKLAKTKDAQNLKRESSVFIYGTIAKVPEGQTAENGIEVQADYLEVVGVAMGDVEQAVNKDCSDEIKVSAVVFCSFPSL
jgi:asparaginyl-tRNA synthetase